MASKILIKTSEQIEGIRRSSELAAKTLAFAGTLVKEGINTAKIDSEIDAFIRDHKAIPAPLNYNGFPKSSCISLNEIVCHGIPSKKTILKPGDILNIDITTILDGYFGDCSHMYWIDPIAIEAQKLIDTTKTCLDIGIEQVKPGNYFGNIGYEIGNFAKSKGYGVVYEFCGHGVGIRFHEPPEIQHIAEKDSGEIMQPGMVFTIEPMINQGKSRTKIDRRDGWTARTIDGKLSAQFEHTILVTSEGYEILTVQ